jgi:thiamine phosphate synthase YjbQ (UPF0047 family)
MMSYERSRAHGILLARCYPWEDNSLKNLSTLCAAFVVLLVAVLGCKQLANVGSTNLFQGDNAAKAAAAIKTKVGADQVKVISAEVRKDSMKITIQAPDNPKNLDEYTFEKGRATGPKPVQAMSLGSLEMTADKYHVTDLGDINFAAISDTVQKAISRSGLENGQVDLITMENASAETVNPGLKAEKKRKAEDLKKQIQEKMADCMKSAASKCMDELQQLQKQQMNSMMGMEQKQWDLAWRIFVEGPRGRKDFYADKQGNIVDNPY